ncbi:E3 ubiquitin-protein ligase RFWD3-like isoform X2 [Neltuma alba]|uniref:E3 ubiquitin-protein ligase RFWD3 isoform X2 n=1 Tax=Neltuma alba TaxID=207710 RepID=UPI0010A59B21|nr:E3 ubiquitin-protein ligase RFWD3 isoform X2 [Prosopis alba]XP_028797916.1 E3 ubiquitin-protein ligase RFWD3-like isoform X2 [Prosopis alba]
MPDPYDFSLYDDAEVVAAQISEGEEDSAASEEEDEDDEEYEDEAEEYIPLVQSRRALQGVPSTSDQHDTIIQEVPDDLVEEEGNKRRRTEGGETCLSLGIVNAESSQGNEWNYADTDGLYCPICLDAWTNDGEHHICSLPCGHIYGMSCIKRWLQQRKNSGKCPQCNRKCALRDVRKLYASRVLAADEALQKKIRSLEARCAILECKGSDWCKKEASWQKKEAQLHLEVEKLTELIQDMERRQTGGTMGAIGNCRWRSESKYGFGAKMYGKGRCCSFELQKEFQLGSALVFDINASNQILLIAQRPKGIGGPYLLTKMSLIPPYEMEDIFLPPASCAIKDLHISPLNSDLALYASLGRKLSVLSMQSNNVAVNYDLQVPAWSCSWDLSSSHYAYAGLQNGSVLVFDLRQTSGPLKSLNGLTSNPVHTVQSLVQDPSLSSGFGAILSASAIGLCQWNIGAEEGPSMIPETGNQGVCISLAYCPSSDDIVISYRPKFDMSIDGSLSQPSLTPSQVIGQGVQGSHVLLKRLDGSHLQQLGSSCANVSNIRLPKCVIMDVESESRLLASEDEVACELVLQELPSFGFVQRLKLPEHARDLKYSPTLNHGLLGCLTGKSLQLFCTKLS